MQMKGYLGMTSLMAKMLCKSVSMSLSLLETWKLQCHYYFQPEGSNFYPNALRAVVLLSAVSRSLHELAVKVVAANMVRTDKSLSGTHLLCAVGRYQEACSQLQDAGCWIDAATLSASHLHGSDYARLLQRWADYVLRGEHNM